MSSINLKPIRDLEEDLITRNPCLLIYGPLGTGKTAFVTQCGAQGLIIDFDQGLRTAIRFKDQYFEKRNECLFVSFHEPVVRVMGDLRPKKYLEARNFMVSYLNEIKKGKIPCPRIVILDSLTGLVVAVKAMIKGNSKHPERNPSREEWGILLNEITNFLGLFRCLPAIKVIVAHDMLLEDADGIVKYKLLCPGKSLPGEIAGLFDDVFYCKILKAAGGKSDRTLSAEPSQAIEARTRSGFQGIYKMNDGFLEFLELLGYLKKEDKK